MYLYCFQTHIIFLNSPDLKSRTKISFIWRFLKSRKSPWEKKSPCCIPSLNCARIRIQRSSDKNRQLNACFTPRVVVYCFALVKWNAEILEILITTCVSCGIAFGALSYLPSTVTFSWQSQWLLKSLRASLLVK